MNLKEAIDQFFDNPVHNYLENGCYINKDYQLQFDKKEQEKLFSNGYYIPSYKKWLMKNSILIYKGRTEYQHQCPFKINICCWRCFMGGECQSACRLNPNECEKRGKDELHMGSKGFFKAL